MRIQHVRPTMKPSRRCSCSNGSPCEHMNKDPHLLHRAPAVVHWREWGHNRRLGIEDGVLVTVPCLHVFEVPVASSLTGTPQGDPMVGRLAAATQHVVPSFSKSRPQVYIATVARPEVAEKNRSVACAGGLVGRPCACTAAAGSGQRD